MTRSTRSGTAGRAVLAMATVGYLALVALFTMAPLPWRTPTDEARFGAFTPSLWTDPSTWTTGSPIEFVANIVMFVPIGLLLRLVFARAAGVAVFAAAASITVAIEALQIPLDRVSDPRDLVANTVGAVIGIAIGAGVVAARRTLRADHRLSA
ncbi:VanZ family protein [Herbiconiux sp. L3-i23]|uniref:VanZ family protein n=1 Tax=Herbiconiux sp. L3-i23 TaxID=2905871 RepID=UPI0020656632|nr:VanZ family protein [Herbiconiux sp. L3-i23]BDI23397.1 hypothetical protein L3i23_21730 [Herbiconiux sp. L3-i23]